MVTKTSGWGPFGSKSGHSLHHSSKWQADKWWTRSLKVWIKTQIDWAWKSLLAQWSRFKLDHSLHPSFPGFCPPRPIAKCPPPQLHCKLYNTNTQIHKYTNTQIHKYTNTQIHKYTNTNTQIQIHIITMITLWNIQIGDLRGSLPYDETRHVRHQGSFF